MLLVSFNETRILMFLFGKFSSIWFDGTDNNTRVESFVKLTSRTTPFTGIKAKESLICGVFIICVNGF